VVFVFASLWFIHYGLAALAALRAEHEAELFVPTRPVKEVDALPITAKASASDLPSIP
jgi:hypothetical protein